MPLRFYFYSKQYSTCQTVNGGIDMALRGFTFPTQRTGQYIGSNVSVVG